MASRVLSRSMLVTIAAILGLVGCLGFAALRLLQANGTVRITSESTLWMVTQAQYEAVQLGRSLALVAAGEASPDPEDAPHHRFTVMLSRVDHLLEGPQARLLEAADDLKAIRQVYRNLLAAEPVLEAGVDRANALRLQEEASHLARLLRSLANRHMLLDREQTSAARGHYVRSIFEGIAAVLGIFVSATVLAWSILDGIRRTRRAEHLLRQEQAFSELVIGLTNQGVVILDEDRTCLLWNPGMEALFDLAPGQVVGRPIRDTAPLFRSAAVAQLLDAASCGTSGTIEAESLGANTESCCLEVSCHPLAMSERRLAVVFVRDATERWLARRRAEQHNVHLESEVKQRTQALQQAEGRLVAAIKTAAEGFAAFGLDGKLLIANDRIRTTEPVASRYEEDMSINAFLACFAGCEGADERLLRSDQALAGSLDMDLRLGAGTWAHLVVTRAEDGTIFVRLSDVTAYKQAALALQSALDREREITGAYRSFVSMVSHQFRTPLAIVDSSAQRILRRNAEVSREELATRVKKIRNATVRLTRLVDSVLNAARIDSGQIEVKSAPCDLVALVSDVCEYQRDISPTFDIRLIAPSHPVELTCDAMLLEQVIANLLSNAVKYAGGSSEIEVRLWVEGGVAKCAVRDWGIGIPTEELPKVFDRFYRARTALGIAGTGIGLNVAQEIVRMHGGDIEVESREAQGSIFTLSIPMAGVEAAPKAA